MANDLQLVLELKASVDQFTRAVQGASSKFGEAMARVEKTAGGAEAGVQQATEGIDKQLRGTGKTAKETGITFEQATKQIGLKRHAEIEREISRVREAYDALARSGKLTGKELAQANVKTREQIKALKRETNDWLGSLGRMKGELAAAGTAMYGLGRGVTSATKASSQFAKAMAEVSTLTDSAADVKVLTGEVERLSQEFGSDVNEQAKALYQIMSAGASSAADATELLTTANQLAVGGVTDVKTAADGLTSILNAYGDEAGGAANVSDALFAAMKAGKTTIGELSSSIGQVAPLAAQAGVRLESMLAAVATLTKGGLSTSQAMTQLRGTLAGVIKPSGEAKKLAKELGLEFNAAALKSKGLAGFLAEVAQKTGGSTEAMATLFGQIEAVNGVLALTGKGAGDFADTLDAMADKAGATQTAYEKMADTADMSARRFAEARKALGRSLGDAVTALTPFLDGLTAVVGMMNRLPGPVKSSVAGLGTLTIGLAAVAGPMGNLAATAKLAAAGLREKGEALSRLAPGLGAAAKGAGALAGRIGALLPTVAALGLAVAGSVVMVQSLAVELARVSDAARQAAAAQQHADEILAEGVGFVRAKIMALEDYKDTTLRSVKEVSLLSKTERDRYRESLEGLRQLQVMELHLAKLRDSDKNDTSARQAQLRDDLAATDKAMRALAEGAGVADEAIRNGLSPSALALADTLEGVVQKGSDAAAALQSLGQPLDPGSVESVTALFGAFDELQRRGVLSSHDIEVAWQQVLSGLGTDQLDRFGVTLAAAFGKGAEAAGQLATVTNGVVDAALKKLGVDTEQIRSGFTAVGKDAIAAFDVVREQIGQTGLSAKQQANALAAAWEGAFKKASTTKELKALQERLKALRRSGTLGAEAADKLAAALEKKLAPAAAAAGAGVAGLGDKAKKTFATLVSSIGQAASAKELRALKTALRDMFLAGEISAEEFDASLVKIETRLDTLAKKLKKDRRTAADEVDRSTGVGARDVELVALQERIKALGPEAEAAYARLIKTQQTHAGLLTRGQITGTAASVLHQYAQPAQATPAAAPPAKTVRVEFGGPGGPSGLFDERDSEQLLALLERHGRRAN